MLTRYYDTLRSPSFDVLDPFNIFGFGDLERSTHRHRADTIDDEGIKIELPGVSSSDVEVTVDEKTLRITGKSRHGNEFSYAYTLKSTVDESAIVANLAFTLYT